MKRKLFFFYINVILLYNISCLIIIFLAIKKNCDIYKVKKSTKQNNNERNEVVNI